MIYFTNVPILSGQVSAVLPSELGRRQAVTSTTNDENDEITKPYHKFYGSSWGPAVECSCLSMPLIRMSKLEHRYWWYIQYIIRIMLKFYSVDVLGCRRFGLSTLRFVDVLVCRRFGFVDVSVCRRFGLSTFRCVDASVCRRFGLSTFRFVDVSVHRRFGCRRFGLSTLWLVTHNNIPYIVYYMCAYLFMI